MSYRVHRHDNTTWKSLLRCAMCSSPEGISSVLLIPALKCSPLCWWGLFIQVLPSMEPPCGIGDSYSLEFIVLSLLSIHAVVQFNWDVDFNLFPKCHFHPAFLLSHSETLLSSGCSDRASSFLEGKRELVNSYLRA